MRLVTSPIRLAKKAVLGTVLGDSYVGNRGGCRQKARIVLTQGAQQFQYLLWKMQLLYPFVGSYNIILGTSTSGRTIVHAQSLGIHELYHVHKDLYAWKDNRWKKTVRLNVLRRLSPLSLAWWYQDDGHLDTKNGQIHKVSLATCGFPYAEQKLIQQYFAEAWKIQVEVYDHAGRYYCINMDKENGEKFIALIAPFIHPIMRYKVDPSHKSAEREVTREEIVRTLQQCKDLVRNYQASSKKALTLNWAEYVKGPKAMLALKLRA
ncbi:hypothetical protein HOO68_05790 [Candidatus Gracilibacteria bacterium]|nr:hypothetical protein [Candidatus Gracilibacteria bacterium]